MTEFTVYPAIDLQHGSVVRLKQGLRNQSTIYADSPAHVAKQFIDQGAKWLHVVNLDGAFGEDSRTNIERLQEIVKTADGSASIQFGGGLRDLAAISHVLSLGVSRVIIGTAAVVDPYFLPGALNAFGSKQIILGVDARQGLVHISGWQDKTDLTPLELVQHFIPSGLETIIYTSILRDGMQTGVDVTSTATLASNSGLEVIASGGVGSIEDIRAVKAAGLPGVIVGKALYEGSFSLSEAISC